MIANYIPPADPMELLVRDVDSNGPFSYLGTVCRQMRQRLENKAMMKSNFDLTSFEIRNIITIGRWHRNVRVAPTTRRCRHLTIGIRP